MADIIVKINADAKQFNDQIDAVKEKTKSLEESLSSVAKTSGLIFGAIAGSAALAIKAYGEAEQAANELTNSLKNQGLESQKTAKGTKTLVDAYKDYATAVSKATGIDDDAITSAQAKLQTYIGQTEITQELTQALADLSIKTGSLDSAAEKLGLAFQGNTGFFNKQKIAVDENATAQERLDQAVAGVSKRMGGQAAAAAQGVGSIKKLNVAVGNLLEDIGKQLAPAFEKGVVALTKFIESIDNDAVVSLAVSFGKVLAVISGGVAILSSGALAFIKIRQALNIATIGLRLMGIAVGGLTAATGLGALIIIATLVVNYWDDIWPRVKAVFVGAMVGIIDSAKAVNKVLSGVFTGNFETILAGVEDFKKSISSGINAGKVTFESETKKTETSSGSNTEKLKQDEAEATAIRAAGIAERKRLDDLNKEQSANTAEIAVLQAQQGSEELIKLKQQENEILKQLETEKNSSIIEALQLRLETVKSLEAEARTADNEERAIFDEQILAKNEEFNTLSKEQKAVFLQSQGAALKASIDTETEARVKFISAQLQQDIAAHNTFLQEQQRYGTAYAAINQAMNSNEVQGASKGVSQLTALQSSKNQTLKTIGKTAAVADIVIKTGQAAMAAFAGFAAIPIVGIPLGIAAAGAVIAFGAEQIGNVVAAEDGGIVPGFNTGGDSRRAILQAGELVVPNRNVDEVINATAAQRTNDSVQATSGVGAAGGGQMVSVNLAFSGDNAEKFLTAKQVESRALGTIREAS